MQIRAFWDIAAVRTSETVYSESTQRYIPPREPAISQFKCRWDYNSFDLNNDKWLSKIFLSRFFSQGPFPASLAV